MCRVTGQVHGAADTGQVQHPPACGEGGLAQEAGEVVGGHANTIESGTRRDGREQPRGTIFTPLAGQSERSVRRYPPIWDMERDARSNASPSLILCFFSLFQTASRIVCSSRSSDAA